MRYSPKVKICSEAQAHCKVQGGELFLPCWRHCGGHRTGRGHGTYAVGGPVGDHGGHALRIH
jgi:hypothetical protein